MSVVASVPSSFPEPRIFWSAVGSFNNEKKKVEWHGALGTRMLDFSLAYLYAYVLVKTSLNKRVGATATTAKYFHFRMKIIQALYKYCNRLYHGFRRHFDEKANTLEITVFV